MRHFLFFVGLVFVLLVAGVLSKNNPENASEKPVVRVFAPASFISQWGPGPWLKEKFETNCQCQLEFIESSEASIMFEKLKTGRGSKAIDLVLGLDQFDLDQALAQVEWQKIELENHKASDWVSEIRASLERGPFVALDWGVLSFVVRKSETRPLPTSLDDLLKPEFRGKISLQDPRTSTPGLQFLLWLVQVKGEDAAFEYIKKLEPQILSYAPSWSAAYGLFQKSQAKTTFSYTTSPVYHLVEEKTQDVVALQFKEPSPIQVEYMGIPRHCQNCDLARRFSMFLLSPEGQKMIMSKNYMFPVLAGVRVGTPFESIPHYDILSSQVIPQLSDRERIVKKWSDIRKAL